MMEARAGGTGAARETAAAAAPDAAQQWIEAWAGHVRKRFNSRAVVSARIGGAAPVVLSQVYALEGGGLVLVAPCDHEADGGAHHHAAPAGAAKRHLVGEEGQRHAGHDHAPHPHGTAEGCGGDCEMWLASAADVVFEARCAEEGALCTGFGVLGLSRTPHVLVARGTEPPPRRGHEHGEF